MSSSERRKAVRAPATLAMEVKLGGVDFGKLSTLNVSANGVYFSSPGFIAPLTRLEITLLIPDTPDGSSKKMREVSCEGIVVRTEPENPAKDVSEYAIACYFTSIAEQDRAHLESYILTRVSF